MPLLFTGQQSKPAQLKLSHTLEIRGWTKQELSNIMKPV